VDKIELNKNNTLPESLSGIVENITFHNEETGFTILKVKVKGHYEPVTVVCTLAAVNIGEWLTAQGSWQRDKYYGLQFRSEQTTTTPPTTLNGIEKYLGSGLIKGIGPVYAKKLVEKFGERVIDIIENQSAKLEEVDGIGKIRRQIIKAAWKPKKVSEI
jgi:exodeoxyribonuclease V alpha subunit